MSERKNQIEEACHQHKEETPLTAFGFNREEIDLLLSAFREAFISGAEWADANPPAHSGDDERDAILAVDEYTWSTREDATKAEKVFLSGRKGMVPASEVDRLRTQLADVHFDFEKRVAEAVRAERERIFAQLNKWTMMEREEISRLINPTPKDGEAE